MTTETDEKTMHEIWARFNDLVLPVILHEVIFKLAEANTFAEAHKQTEDLFKDVFYCGAETYQIMLHKQAPTTGEKLKQLKKFDAELAAYTESVKIRMMPTTTH